jgi:hypothetical protein
LILKNGADVVRSERDLRPDAEAEVLNCSALDATNSTFYSDVEELRKLANPVSDN